MEIPGKSDWKDAVLGLDEKCAYDHFFGKNKEEAQQLFAHNSLYYREDLMWMPVKPFQYYASAFMNYLMNAESKEDSDAASGFISLVSHKLGTEGEDLVELWPRIEEVLEVIKSKQSWYVASEEIYGNFTHRVARIYKKANKPSKAVVLTPVAARQV